MSMTGPRFEELWGQRSGDNSIRQERLSDDEKGAIMAEWDRLDGASCWMDAFHSLWRKVDPAGHLAIFRGTFYESAESMRAGDDDELA